MSAKICRTCLTRTSSSKTTPISELSDAERGSKLKEPMNPALSSTVKALVCRLALLDPNKDMWLRSSYGLSSNRWTPPPMRDSRRSEEHTSELQSLMRISYAVFCLKKKKNRDKQKKTE